MTSDIAQPGHELPRGERDDLRARPWSEWLPRVAHARGESERKRRVLRDTLQAFESEFGKLIEQSIGDWWVLPEQRSQGLEMSLLTPEQERHALTLYHPAIRIGTDSSCQIRLNAPEVCSHHCEIRVEAQALWCLLLESSAVVRVNGRPISSEASVPLATGDTLEIGPFLLTVGMQRVRKVDDSTATLELNQPLYFKARSPIQVLGEHSAWIRVACNGWQGYIKIPEGWLRSAYRQLGWEPKEPSRFPVEDEVDRSLTAFVLHRIGQSFAERSGLELNLSGVVDGTVMLNEMPLDEEWAGVRFRLRLGDRLFESEAVWAHKAEDSAARRLHDLRFPVSIVGGWVTLTDRDIRSLSGGDILLPDVWLPGAVLSSREDDSEQGSEAPGHEVFLSIQGWQRSATLSNSTIEIPESAWRLPDSGGFVTDEEMNREEADELATSVQGSIHEVPDTDEVLGEPVDLERELEVVVAFELDRISVPLEEISRWEEGATVQLDRSPNDHVKILLRQGKGARLLGYGRAIVVDDKLGIQIQKWLGRSGS